MTTITTLPEAIAELVHDGDTLALEGFTHLIPVAAGQEIIRQGRRDLTVARMTPDIVYDQMIGAGCVRKLIFSWGGNPGVGSLHRFRDAIENGWPRPLEIEEHSHAGHGQPLRGRSRWPAVRRVARLPRHRPRRAHGDAGADHLPVHRRGVDGRAGDQPGRVDRSCPTGRHHRQRDAVGNHRRAEGSRAGSAAGAGHRRGDRGRAGTTPRCRSSSRRGPCRTSPPSPAAPIRATPRATPLATTTTTAPGTRSRRTAGDSPTGWTTNVLAASTVAP